MRRCTYEYGDGQRCVFKGIEDDEDMCPEHRLITKARERDKNNKAAKRVRVNKQIRFVSNTIVGKPVIHDITTPWHCGTEGCKEHKGKPTFDEYMKERYG